MRRPLRTLLPLALLLTGCAGVPRRDVLRAQDLREPRSEELVRASRAATASRRKEALLAMARIQSPFYVDAEGARLSDRSKSARLAAAFALGQLGLAEKPAAPETQAALAEGRRRAAALLRPLTRSSSYELRAAATRALGKVGDASDEPLLAAALRDADPDVRVEGALGLFRLRMQAATPEFSSASVRALRVAFSDPEPAVRRAAVYPFSRYAEPRLASPLAEECGPGEGDAWTRLYACRALGLIGKAAPWEELAQTLTDGNAQLRYEAVRALGLQGRAEYLTESVFTDPSADVRAAVAEALAAGGDRKSAYKLDAVEEGDSVLVRAAATAGYVALKPKEQAVRRLKEDLEDKRWWARSHAYEGVRKLALWSLAERPESDPRVSPARLEAAFEAARSSEAASALLVDVLRDTAAPVELAGTAIELAPKAPSPAVLAALKSVREGPLGARYPEVGSDAAEAYNALASTMAPAAAKLTPVPTQPAAPSPWLKQKLPPTSVVLVTEKGEIELALAVDEAPIHAAAFADSVRRNVYDGLTWHRVVPGFVVQGGDPRGSGWGDCGFSLRDEINTLPFDRGVVGMPKAGKDTGGCQLFVTLVPTPHLDGRYTVFGRITRGMDVVDKLEPGDKILSARISSRPTP